MLNFIRKSKANHFNIFFQESKVNLFKTIKKVKDNLVKSKFNYVKYLSNPNEQSFFIKPKNTKEVLCKITKLFFFYQAFLRRH